MLIKTQLIVQEEETDFSTKARNIETEMSNITGLVTNGTLNTTFKEFENKIRDTAGLVRKIVFNAKVIENE